MDFNDQVDSIEAEYSRRGDSLGWRWLYSPQKTLEHARVALLGLNPTGGTYEPPAASYEDGSAYASETWRGLPPGHDTLPPSSIRPALGRIVPAIIFRRLDLPAPFRPINATAPPTGNSMFSPFATVLAMPSA